MEERGTAHPYGRPLVFGEVLFDRFKDDGADVLGGAPFNVAWHLQGFGLNPLFISRIGRDSLGERVLEAMDAWGMDTAALQKDPTHPTGVVEIEVHEGQPTFDIRAGAAYDFIDGGAALSLLEGAPWNLLYHGSLATRHPTSREALTTIRRLTELPAFVDINLRAPWWNMPEARAMVRGQRWVKLNDDELRTLLDDPVEAMDEAAEKACTRFGIDWLLVTLGAEGAIATDAERVVRVRAARVESLVDTVGAGDAFSAVVILGLTGGWPSATILERATEFAAAICQVRGATVADRGFYTYHLDKWGA
jgi:fructokinase